MRHPNDGQNQTATQCDADTIADDDDPMRQVVKFLEEFADDRSSVAFWKLVTYCRQKRKHVAHFAILGRDVEVETLRAVLNYANFLAAEEMIDPPPSSQGRTAQEQLRMIEVWALEQSDKATVEFMVLRANPSQLLATLRDIALLFVSRIEDLRRDLGDREHRVCDWHADWKELGAPDPECVSLLVKVARLATQYLTEYGFDPLPPRVYDLITDAESIAAWYESAVPKAGGRVHENTPAEGCSAGSGLATPEAANQGGIDPSQVELYVDLVSGGFAILPGQRRQRIRRECLRQEHWHELYAFANNKGQQEIGRSRRKRDAERKYLQRIGDVLRKELGLSMQPIQLQHRMLISRFRSISASATNGLD